MPVVALPVNRANAACEARHLVAMAAYGLLSSPALLHLPTSAQAWSDTEQAWSALAEAKACYDLVIAGGCRNEM